jgi:hypothetical protein
MLTIYQEPVTLPDRGEPVEISVDRELASIAAEIAARLEEMEGLKLMSGGALVSKLSACRTISPVVFRLTIQLLSGNTEPLQSYAQRALKRGVSKQTVFLETKNEMKKVAHVFPDLIYALEQELRTALAHEDPTSNADSIRDATR